jgi:hypothetical protein
VKLVEGLGVVREVAEVDVLEDFEEERHVTIPLGFHGDDQLALSERSLLLGAADGGLVRSGGEECQCDLATVDGNLDFFGPNVAAEKPMLVEPRIEPAGLQVALQPLG